MTEDLLAAVLSREDALETCSRGLDGDGWGVGS